MGELPALAIRNRQQWERWLRTHHASSSGVWLVVPRQRTAAKAIAYEDAVMEALRFGWIDSLVKRIDEDRYARKFTPRQPNSKWSDLNRRRWEDLRAAGRLTPAGLRAAPTANRYTPRVATLPAYIGAAFRSEPKAWRFFQDLAPSYRRQFVQWIHAAKRPETRAKRMAESIRLLASGRKLGLK